MLQLAAGAPVATGPAVQVLQGRSYSAKELDRLLCSFVHNDCTRGEVADDNDINVGDIVTKKHDPRNDQWPYVVHKSLSSGNKLWARNGNGGVEYVNHNDWYVWTRAAPDSKVTYRKLGLAIIQDK